MRWSQARGTFAGKTQVSCVIQVQRPCDSCLRTMTAGTVPSSRGRHDEAWPRRKPERPQRQGLHRGSRHEWRVEGGEIQRKCRMRPYELRAGREEGSGVPGLKEEPLA